MFEDDIDFEAGAEDMELYVARQEAERERLKEIENDADEARDSDR